MRCDSSLPMRLLALLFTAALLLVGCADAPDERATVLTDSTSVGAFIGVVTRNTDGIALTQHDFGPFPHGAFYAVHDDGNVAAFSWKALSDALGLRQDCSAQP